MPRIERTENRLYGLSLSPWTETWETFDPATSSAIAEEPKRTVSKWEASYGRLRVT